MIKKIFLYIIFAFLIFSLYFVIYAKTIQNDLSHNIIRLHVIANSDSAKDQEIKLKIRDALLSQIDSKNFSNFEGAYVYIQNNIEYMEEIANNLLLQNDFNYTAKVILENSFFATKNYGDIHLPAGKYLALKVLLGDNCGKNWWCVMFPPLCFSENSTTVLPSSSQNTLEKNLSPYTFDLISCENIEFKFKIVDFINSI